MGHGDADLQRLGQQLNEGARSLRQVVDWAVAQDKSELAGAYFGSVPLLMLAGDVLGGWMLARSVLACEAQPNAIDADFANTKKHAALLYGDMVLIPGLGRAHLIQNGSKTVRAALNL